MYKTYININQRGEVICTKLCLAMAELGLKLRPLCIYSRAFPFIWTLGAL